MRLTYGRLILGVAALCAAAAGCGGGSRCCTPVDASSTKDAANTHDGDRDQVVDASLRDARDAPVDHGIDARSMDASTRDSRDAAGGLPCPKASWDANLSNTNYCWNGIGIPSFLETGTCGDYRLIENSTNGDDEIFYYFDASGALVAIVDFSSGQYRCTAGLVAAVDRPCIYSGSPSVTHLRCRADGGPTDGPTS